MVRSDLEATTTGDVVGVGVTLALGSFLQEEASINKLREKINSLFIDLKFILFNIFLVSFY
ncbi:MAG: hypothetical protein B7Y76_12670, partial [Sphingobacteriia bacterium 35-40-5]